MEFAGTLLHNEVKKMSNIFNTFFGMIIVCNFFFIQTKLINCGVNLVCVIYLGP